MNPIMPAYSKENLRDMGRVASEDFLRNSVPLSEGVKKVASRHRLNDHQVELVCHFANHHTSKAHMEKEAYVDFDLAKSSDVLGTAKVAATLFFVPISEEQGEVKTASVEEQAEAYKPDLFSKIASFYKVAYHPCSDSLEGAWRFVNAAETVGHRAIQSLGMQKLAMDANLQAFYDHFRQELLSGVPLDTLIKRTVEEGYGPLLNSVWPRLEAENFVQASDYEDEGPVSLTRLFKKAYFVGVRAEQLDALPDDLKKVGFNLEPSGKMFKYAAAYHEAREQSKLDSYVAELCLSGLDGVDKIAGFTPDEQVKEASAKGMMRVLSSAKNMFKRAPKPVIPQSQNPNATFTSTTSSKVKGVARGVSGVVGDVVGGLKDRGSKIQAKVKPKKVVEQPKWKTPKVPKPAQEKGETWADTGNLAINKGMKAYGKGSKAGALAAGAANTFQERRKRVL
jgi:hypothetical protein